MTIEGTVASDDLRRTVHPDDSIGLSAQIVRPIARPAGKIQHTEAVKFRDPGGCPHVSRQVHDVLRISWIGLAAFHEIVLCSTPAAKMNRQPSARRVYSIIDESWSDTSGFAGAVARLAHTPSTAAIAPRCRLQSTLS